MKVQLIGQDLWSNIAVEAMKYRWWYVKVPPSMRLPDYSYIDMVLTDRAPKWNIESEKLGDYSYDMLCEMRKHAKEYYFDLHDSEPSEKARIKRYIEYGKHNVYKPLKIYAKSII